MCLRFLLFSFLNGGVGYVRNVSKESLEMAFPFVKAFFLAVSFKLSLAGSLFAANVFNNLPCLGRLLTDMGHPNFVNLFLDIFFLEIGVG